MKRIAAQAIWMVAILIGLPMISYGDQGSDKTLSPYFQVLSKESSLENFPLKSTDVNATISGVIANVVVRQVYANRGNTPINGLYLFPGSTRAAVHGMTMTVGERVIKARIKEKEMARKTYETAKKQGKATSLLEQHRPNVFSMEVANIMPGETIEIALNYTELLVPEDGTYEFVYPTVVGPRYSSVPANEASRDNRWVQNPYLKSGSDPHTEFALSVDLVTGMPLHEVHCETHDANIVFESESRVQVDLSGQSEFGGDRDFILQYRLTGEHIESGLILQQGEGENFFLLMTQPPQRIEQSAIPPREYIFIVDISGSMAGYPLDTAKSLLANLIGNLRPTDTFNVLLFAGSSEIMSGSSVPANPTHVQRAIHMIDDSKGGGGTELLQAMTRAMDLPKKEGVSRTMIVITDGYVHTENDIFKVIQQNLDHTNLFAFGIGSSVNRHLIEGMARSGQGAPFIVTSSGQAGPAAQRFLEYIKSPVLTDIEISFEGLDVYDVEPPAQPDLFAERPVVVFGKWKGEPTGSVIVSGMNGTGRYHKEITVDNSLSEDLSAPLKYLWARSRIDRISNFNSQKGNRGKREELVSLGLQYNLLTQFTSFVAVDEIVRNPDGQSKDVKQPLTLPKNVSNLAVGGGMRSVPEPGVVLIALMFLLFLVVSKLPKNGAGVLNFLSGKRR